jgi:hypothetical protein
MWLAEKIYPGNSYDELKQMTLDFWLTAEDLPSPENRVELTKHGQIKVHYTRTNYTAYERLKEKLKEVLAKVGKLDDRFADIQWAVMIST